MYGIRTGLGPCTNYLGAASSAAAVLVLVPMLLGWLNEYAHPSLEDLRIGPELQPNQEEHLRVCDAAILRFWARDARTHRPAPPFDQERA